MILSYRKREESPPDDITETFCENKTRSRSPEDRIIRRREKKAKSFGEFWLNLFRSPVANQLEKRRSRQVDDIVVSQSFSPSSSAESVNTILSTHSFSFVSPRSYVGRKERKRGRRIPMDVEDNNFRSKPQKPQQVNGSTSKAAQVTSSGTLTRIGLKLGFNLKSKYNLQSCESLAVTPYENSTLLKRRNLGINKRNRDIPGPSSDIKDQNFIASLNFECKRVNYSKERKYEASLENSIQTNLNDQNGTQNLSGSSTQKKRRAPPPPTHILGSNLVVSSHLNEEQILNLGASENKEYLDRHRRCQSETPAYETLKTRLHVNGKRRAPNPPLVQNSEVSETFEQQQTQNIVEIPTAIDEEENMSPGKHQHELPEPVTVLLTSSVKTTNAQVIEPKFHPRPWYKRNPTKHQAKRQIQNPISHLPNLSNLDREAARIVEENHRRSAEQAYNQTAKELITMFNQNFTKPEQEEGSQPKVNDTQSLAVDRNGHPQGRVNMKPTHLVSGSKNLPFESEENKKLAIVQPQKFETSKTASVHVPRINSPSSQSGQVERQEIEVSRSSYQNLLFQNSESEWICPRCTLRNPHWRALCDVCYIRKDFSGNIKKEAKSQARDIKISNEEFSNQTSTVNDLPKKVNDSGSKLNKNISKRDTRNLQNNKIHKENNNFPLCENFLSQVPSKDLSKEKLLGVKLFEPLESDYEELNIEALRKARVAFFTKNSSTTSDDFKPNNLNPKHYEKEFKELNLPPTPFESTNNDELSDDLEVIDLLLKIYQETQLNSNENGRVETLKSKKFKPILATVLESSGSNGQNIENVYKELRSSQEQVKRKRPTNSLMQQNIQKTIKKQLLLYESNAMDEDKMTHAQGLETTVEEYRKQGAIPKHLIQGHRQNDRKGRNLETNSKNDSTAVVSSLLRKLDWAISHGDFRQAAKLAFELATYKPEPIAVKPEEPITIRVYVEDRLLQQGPFVVTVTPSMTIAMLKTKIESDWGIPANFQKWILGKKMAEGDEDLISNYELQNDTLSFLYLVTPDFEKREGKRVEGVLNDEKMLNLDAKDVEGQLDANLNIPSPTINHDDTIQIETTNFQLTAEDLPLNLTENILQVIFDVPNDLEPNSNCKIKNIEKSQESLHVTDESTSVINVASSITVNCTKDSTPIEIDLCSTQAPETAVEENINEPCNFNIIDSEHKTEEEVTSNQASTITSVTFESLNESDTKHEILLEQKCKSLPMDGIHKIKHLEPIKNEQTPTQEVKLSITKRRRSYEDSNFTSSQNNMSLPLGRRLSGTLIKQIEKFEALNNSKKYLNERHENNSKKVEKSPEVQISSRINVDVSNTQSMAAKIGTDMEKNAENYMKLLELEKADLIRSEDKIDCPVCLSNAVGGIVLRDCLHTFCQECLVGAIEYAEEAQVKCPFRDKDYACDSIIQEREIKALVPKETFHRLLAQSVKLAECKMANAFHCKTNDCPGWCVFEDNVNIFRCPVCSKSNCLNCQAIHEGCDCRQYQRQFAIAAETDEDAKSSRLMLEKMIERGEALDCPACHVVLLKKWGCDWVRCSYCKTEICWVTKGFRWGSNGKGDTSGGCKCGLNGVKCHHKCTYCH